MEDKGREWLGTVRRKTQRQYAEPNEGLVRVGTAGEETHFVLITHHSLYCMKMTLGKGERLGTLTRSI